MLSNTYYEEVSKILNRTLWDNNSGFDEFWFNYSSIDKNRGFQNRLKNYATRR